MKSVIIVEGDHVYELYGNVQGPRKRHRRFQQYLQKLMQSNATIAVVIEEAGPGMFVERQVNEGQKGSIPMDVAQELGARFRFADLPLDDCRRLLGGHDSEDVTAEERKVLYPDRERAMGDAVLAELGDTGEDVVLLVCGEKHGNRVRARIGDAADVTLEDTRRFGWQNVNVFDREE